MAGPVMALSRWNIAASMLRPFSVLVIVTRSARSASGCATQTPSSVSPPSQMVTPFARKGPVWLAEAPGDAAASADFVRDFTA